MATISETDADELYAQMLVLQLIECTKGCAVTWYKTSLTDYTTQWTVSNRYYDVSLTYLRSMYQLNFIRNRRLIYSVDSNLVSEVFELYRVIEIFFNNNLSVLLQAIQNQNGCDNHFITIDEIEGGVVCGGSAIEEHLPRLGGVVCGGTADIQAIGIAPYSIHADHHIVNTSPGVQSIINTLYYEYNFPQSGSFEFDAYDGTLQNSYQLNDYVNVTDAIPSDDTDGIIVLSDFQAVIIELEGNPFDYIDPVLECYLTGKLPDKATGTTYCKLSIQYDPSYTPSMELYQWNVLSLRRSQITDDVQNLAIGSFVDIDFEIDVISSTVAIATQTVATEEALFPIDQWNFDESGIWAAMLVLRFNQNNGIKPYSYKISAINLEVGYTF